MQIDWCQSGSRLLIALALVSLAIGPSPAAATAMLAASADQSEAAAESCKMIYDRSEPIPDPAERSDNGGMTTSYVAPTSAKPHDSKETVRPVNTATSPVTELIVPPQMRAFPQHLHGSGINSPHCYLPIRPNAPPALG